MKQFSKSSFQVLGGVRISAKADTFVTEFNFRDDLTSENKSKIGEARISVYARHHLFFRATAGVLFYRSGGKSLTGTALTAVIGLHF